MKTVEEILTKVLNEWNNPNELDLVTILAKRSLPFMKMAMEEYAEQRNREEAMMYLNWVKENHYWKSTDSRYPETLGRWIDAINGNVPFKDSLSDIELYVLFKIQNP